MGQKNKGGMWCEACDRPVMGVKNTHRIRNTVSVGTTVSTFGVSLLGAKVEGYVCPTCGGGVHRKGHTSTTSAQGLTDGLQLVTLVLSAVLWLVVAMLT